MAETVTRAVLTEVLEQHAADLKAALEDVLQKSLVQLKNDLREEKEKTWAGLQEGKSSRRLLKQHSQRSFLGHGGELKTARTRMLKTAVTQPFERTANFLQKSGSDLPRDLARTLESAASAMVHTASKGALMGSQAVSHTAVSATQAASQTASSALSATQLVGNTVKQGARKCGHNAKGVLFGSHSRSLDELPAAASPALLEDRPHNEESEPTNKRVNFAHEQAGAYTELPSVDAADSQEMSQSRSSAGSMRNSMVGEKPVRTHRAGSKLRNLTWEEDSEDSDEEPSLLFKLVNAKGFDLTVSSVIIFNACLVGIETDYMARHWARQLPFPFLIADMTSCVFFATEMVLRLLAFGRRFFTSRHRYKNLFDLACVAAQLSDFGLVISHGRVSHTSATLSQNLRLLRFFRIAHIFQNIPELRHLLSSIAHSLKSLLWTLVVLLLVVYFVAIILTQLVTAAKLEFGSEKSSNEDEIDQFFGTLPRSVLSLYAAVSEGLEWQEVTIPLRKYLKNSMIDVLFALYMSFMLYAMLNIVTGHIVEAAIAVAQEEKRKKIGKSLRSIFDRVDEQSTGEIKFEDFKDFLVHDSATKKFLHEIELDPYEAISVFFYLDKDHTNVVDTEELVQGCIRFRGAAKVSHVLAFMDEFQEHAVYVERMLENLGEYVESSFDLPRQTSFEVESASPRDETIM